MDHDYETRRRPLRIFLASTSKDLVPHRIRVASAIEQLGQQPRRMETFVAEPEAPVAVCRKKAAAADALIVCVAHCYGYVPGVEEGGDGKKSVTWHEVEAAQEADRPVFAFVVDPEYAWAGSKEQDRLLQARTQKEMVRIGSAVHQLKAFKEFLGREVVHTSFTTSEDLAAKVTASLSSWLLEAMSHSSTSPLRRSEAASPIDLTSYLEALVDRTEHINVSGITTQHARGALHYRIEQLYTTLSGRGVWTGEGEAEPKQEMCHKRVNLAVLLSCFKRLLIEGQPGAGKTTFLRFAACMLARDVLGVRCPGGGSWRGRYLGIEDDKPKTPIFLRVADLVLLLTEAGAPQLRNDNRQWLLDLLARTCEEDRHDVSREHWEKLLQGDDAVLLLDGLDEAADERLRERIFCIVRDAEKNWQCAIVVTSRPIETAPLRDNEFLQVVIEPFEEEEVRTFVGHWVAALHDVEQPLHGGETRRYCDSLAEAIVGRSRVRRLAANPMILTYLCMMHWNDGRLPEGRSRVYRAVLSWLIAARGRLRQAEGFTDLFALRAFARLALAMMDTPCGKRLMVDLEEAAVAIEPILAEEFQDLSAEERRLRARRWLSFECLGSGVVEEVDGRQLRFWHPTFQDFLAAFQLALRGDYEDPKTDWWPVVCEHLDHAQWQETIELLPGCLLDEGGMGRVHRLLGRVLARGARAELVTEARFAAVVGRLLQTLGVHDYKPSPEISAAYEQALERSLAIFDLTGAAKVPVKTRIVVAEALGRGGDPRLAPEVDNLILVPGDGYRLGKYPVTVEEYQRFVEGRGYDEREHWCDEGWELKAKVGWVAPEKWEEQLESPNRPVVYVSWYEAEAYCHWFGRQRDCAVQLPAAEEWEKAATPERGAYPWGEPEPDEERANFERNVGFPTPVGIYPSGNGPFGHCDLAGNVWEWCADEDADFSEEGKIWRVLRGGCWLLPANDLRVNYRYMLPASDRSRDIGFRVSAVHANALTKRHRAGAAQALT